MSERTKGKLTADEDTVNDLAGNVIAEVTGSRTGWKEDVANAARLAACWNACEGLTDQEVAEGVVIPRSLLIDLFRNDIDANCIDNEGDADGVTLRISHVDYEAHRHVVRMLKEKLEGT